MNKKVIGVLAAAMLAVNAAAWTPIPGWAQEEVAAVEIAETQPAAVSEAVTPASAAAEAEAPAPMTAEPVTEAPATEAPATEVPVTEVPATEAPVTEAPATEAPATEVPATEAPATEAPATEAPATEAPVTEAPATEAPATEAPATEAPATEAPATEAPATEAPATEAPITEAPATEVPATEVPATEAPAKEALRPLRLYLTADKQKVGAGESVQVSLRLAAKNADVPLDDFYVAVDVHDVRVVSVSHGGAILAENGQDGRILLLVKNASVQDGAIVSESGTALRLNAEVVPFDEGEADSVAISVRLLDQGKGEMTPANAGAGTDRIQTALSFARSSQEAAEDGLPHEETREPAQQETAESAARSARIIQSIPNEDIKLGDTLVLTAQLIGFENMEYVIQWQVNDGTGYRDIENAVGDTFVVTVAKENASHAYRFVVNTP